MFQFGQIQSKQIPLDTTVSLSSVLRAVWRRKLLLIISIIGAAGISFVAFTLAKPAYESSTSLVVGQAGGTDIWEAMKRSSELVTSQARIAESDEVIKAAIEKVGRDRLMSAAYVGFWDGLSASVARSLFSRPRDPANEQERAIQLVKDFYDVTTEQRSDIIKLSYKSSDPYFAAEFANTLAQSFIDRQNVLASNPGLAQFFDSKTKTFQSEIDHTATELQDFAKQYKAFSIDEQRALLLKRNSDAVNALATTRNSIASKHGEKAALVSQLKLLRPVTLTPYVSSLIGSLAPDDKASIGIGQGKAHSEQQGGSVDPPLLMVKVYQDLMVTLFKINSEIAGLQDLAKRQQADVETTENELLTLSRNEKEFNRLRRELNLAAQNADVYAKKAVEEQVSWDILHAKVSKIKVFQPAVAPIRPFYPKLRWFLSAGIGSGLSLGLAVILVLEFMVVAQAAPGSMDLFSRSQPQKRPAVADATTERAPKPHTARATKALPGESSVRRRRKTTIDGQG